MRPVAEAHADARCHHCDEGARPGDAPPKAIAEDELLGWAWAGSHDSRVGAHRDARGCRGTSMIMITA